MATKNSPTVLVTGINGYVGAVAAEMFLEAGYRVRGTVRSLAKYQDLISRSFQSQLDADLLELVEIPDFLVPGACDGAMNGVSGVAHVSIPAISKEDLVVSPNITIRRARDAVISILQSAQAHGGPQLKSFVLLSSLAAVMNPLAKAGTRYTSESEVQTGLIDAAVAQGDAAPVPLLYGAIKAAVEQSFWNFMKDPDRTLPFAGVAINPCFCIGPISVKPENPRSLPPAVQSIWHVYGGGAWPADLMVPDFVDVRDVARALLFGVQHPEKANGQRFILAAYCINNQAFADVLRTKFPERKDIIREGEPGKGYPADYVSADLDNIAPDGSGFAEMSGQDYIPFLDTVADTAKSFAYYLEKGKDEELSDQTPVLF
jgi:nucleoside-diphosphate-sugar epimerase